MGGENIHFSERNAPASTGGLCRGPGSTGRCGTVHTTCVDPAAVTGIHTPMLGSQGGLAKTVSVKA